MAGLIRCAHCGHRFVGNAATGNRYRYRYYTCFSRQRYGAASCSAERLPADELDAAVLDALLDTYGRYDLFERAVRAATDRAGALRSQHEQELAVTEAEIANAEAAIDRYLLPSAANGSAPW